MVITPKDQRIFPFKPRKVNIFIALCSSECASLYTASLVEKLRKSNGVANFLVLTWIAFDDREFLEKIRFSLYTLATLVDLRSFEEFYGSGYARLKILVSLVRFQFWPIYVKIGQKKRQGLGVSLSKTRRISGRHSECKTDEPFMANRSRTGGLAFRMGSPKIGDFLG